MMWHFVRKIPFKIACFFIVTNCFFSCTENNQLFERLSSKHSGITFKNQVTSTENFNIIDYPYFYNGGGVAVGDINGDDLPDIFFSGNQVRNRLYLNKGNLKFEDITESAGVGGSSSWNTGSIMADVNGDGLLDIYVCAVVGIRNLLGHNELFINNGDNTFTERSAEYGLDFQTYCSSAAFLDYDLDGDLDMYLLNHAIHTVESFGHANLRNNRTDETGGKLLRNDDGKFVDVSQEANIYGGVNGYGLGVAISDFNSDGYPDIFVGNDFHEDDYLYFNNGNGTFAEKGKEAFTMMSKFSMGNDVADINHDGLPDLITLDMLPEDEVTLKRSVDEENFGIMRLRTEKYGYYYQFPRNMLQINNGNGSFTESALMSGIAATDWSWSALFADYDLDGHQDLFISNGIPRRPNDLDYIKYVSSEEVSKIIGSTRLADEKALAFMPSGVANNYIFKGSGAFSFNNKSKEWLPDEKTCSTATALGDLDRDGDLDIIINNINEEASIYINKSKNSFGYLKIAIKEDGPNTNGLGAKVYTYHNGLVQMKEMYSARGFQSSSEPIVHFGYGNAEIIDSVIIKPVRGGKQTFYNVKLNQKLLVEIDNGVKHDSVIVKNNSKLFERVNASDLGLDFIHKEDDYTDFDRIKLLPYQLSDRGPASAVGDINGDGLTDLFFGSSKHIPNQIFIQGNDKFERLNFPGIRRDSINEEVDAVIQDFNNDGKNEIFVGTGGADFYGKSRPLLDGYYQFSADDFVFTELQDLYENASCVRVADFDQDGDLDIFVGNQSVSNDFGRIPRSYLLVNNDGKFIPAQSNIFDQLGMVTDAVWHDYNSDGQLDLIVVGEWMHPIFLTNNNGIFKHTDLGLTNLNGLWQSIQPFDIDKDGDIDYVLGNWGLNSKYLASKRYPLKMYYGDFDDNGSSETILAIEKRGEYYPLDGLDILASQISGLKRKFTDYKSFAGKTIEEVFTRTQLKNAKLFVIQQLASGYLINESGKFHFVEMPAELQLAPIMASFKYDFNSDGNEEVLIGGNYFGLQPFHGRFGSFSGALIDSDLSITMGHQIGLELFNVSVRAFNVISFKKNNYLVVTINNGEIQIYRLKN